MAPASTAVRVLATAQPVSLWQWIPTRTPVDDDVVDDVAHPARQHAAVGVAQRDDLGTGVVRRAQHLERVVTVGAVAVEEVLGVQEHRLPLLAEVGDGVADHREVLLERGPQRQLDVAVVRLGDQGDDRGAAVAERGDQRVVCRAYAGAAGGAERRELGVPQVELVGGAAEELGVLGVRPRPAALDVADAQPVELLGDGQLVGDRQVESLLLGAVAQGGVVDVEGALEVHLFLLPRPDMVSRRVAPALAALAPPPTLLNLPSCSGSSQAPRDVKKPLVWTRGWRGGRVPTR